jgi:hypothetical protein
VVVFINSSGTNGGSRQLPLPGSFPPVGTHQFPLRDDMSLHGALEIRLGG